MIHWIRHSYAEDNSSPEDGPGFVEQHERTAVEVVNGKASIVQFVGAHEAQISGEGFVDLEEVEKAGKWLRAYENLMQQLDALQDPRLYSEETLDEVGALIAVEDRLMREAAEYTVARSENPSITTGCGFACLCTYFFGSSCKVVWDTENGGELLGVIKSKTAVVADHEDDVTPHYRWAVLDVMQMAMDNDFEYFFDSELEACKALRESMKQRSLVELCDTIKGSSLMIER